MWAPYAGERPEFGLDRTRFGPSEQNILLIDEGRPRGTVGNASAFEARSSEFEFPWLVQPVALGIAIPFAGWKRGCHPSD